MLQWFIEIEKERKLQYQWYHNFRSYVVREGGVEGLESTPKLLGLPWSFGFGGRCSPSDRRLVTEMKEVQA